METQKPSPGRIVIYKYRVEADGSGTDLVEVPAVVTGINPDGSLNLRVLEANTFDVQPIGPDSLVLDQGWSWPPRVG